jgi:hypothetical protein
VELCDGVGDFELTVKMFRVEEDDSRVEIGKSSKVHIEFEPGKQLWGYSAQYHFVNVPFDQPRLYEFRCFGGYMELQGSQLEGPIAQIRVLDESGTP